MSTTSMAPIFAVLVVLGAKSTPGIRRFGIGPGVRLLTEVGRIVGGRIGGVVALARLGDGGRGGRVVEDQPSEPGAPREREDEAEGDAGVGRAAAPLAAGRAPGDRDARPSRGRSTRSIPPDRGAA